MVGEASDGARGGRARPASCKPDVVLMDIRMPQLDGIEATRRVVALDAEPPVRVLMLTTFDLNEYVYEALRAGASGFLLKDVPPEQLAAGIRVVAQGEALLAPSITKRLIQEFASAAPAPPTPPPGLDELTARELEVFKLIARGLSNAEIAAELIVSRDDGQDPRRARADEARAARPRPGRGARVRVRRLGAGPRGIVKLVTWNVNSIAQRMPRVLEFAGAARARRAAAAGDQGRAGRVPDSSSWPPPATTPAHHSAGRWAGVAMLAREPLERRPRRARRRAGGRRGALDRGDRGGLRLRRSTCPTAARSTTRVRQEARVPRRGARAESGRSTCSPATSTSARADIDVYDPAAFVGSTHVQPEERARFAALLEDGHVDAFRHLHPDEVGFTWWDYRQGHFHRKMGLRIDAFIVGRRLAEPHQGVWHRPQLPQGHEAVRPRSAAARARLARRRRRAAARRRAASVRKFTMHARSPKRPSITALEQYTRPSAWIAVISRSLSRSSCSSLPRQPRRPVAEAADREPRLAHQLEVRVLLDELAEVAGERGVVRDPLAVRGPAVREQRDPDLERGEPARELRAVHREVDPVARRLVEPDVGGVGVERAAQVAEVAHQHAAGGLRPCRATCAGRRRSSRRARSRPAAARSSSESTAAPPYAASTWNHSSCSAAMSASSGSGSIEPVVVVPAVAQTASGRDAGVARRARSRRAARPGACAARRRRRSRGPRRRRARACRRRGGSRRAPPRRRRSRPGRASRTPCSRTSSPSRSSRAHFSPTKFAIAPPVMIIPPAPSRQPEARRRASA